MQISLESANWLYSWGWRASIVGAAITLFGVGMLWIGTRARDKDFELRVSAANTEAQRLRSQLGGRKLNEEQSRRLIAELAGVRNKLPEIIFTVLGDEEAGAYGSAVLGAFKAAGLQLKVHSVGMYMPPTYGIVIDSDTPEKLLAKAFASAGIEARSEYVPGKAVNVLVGLKPAPF